MESIKRDVRDENSDMDLLKDYVKRQDDQIQTLTQQMTQIQRGNNDTNKQLKEIKDLLQGKSKKKLEQNWK